MMVMRRFLPAVVGVVVLTSMAAYGEEENPYAQYTGGGSAATSTSAPLTETPDGAQQEAQLETEKNQAEAKQEALKAKVEKDAYSFAPDAFTFEVSTGVAEEYSKKKFQEATFTVKNTLPIHVEILQGEVMGALNEEAVAQAKAESKAKKRKWGAMGLNVASALPGVGYLGYGSYAAAVAVNSVRSVANTTAYALNTMPDGGVAISGQYVQRFNNVVLSPGQTFTYKALMPKDAQPATKLVVKDLNANNILDVTHQ